MELIWTIVIGFIVGVLAKFVTHGPGPQGFFLTAALGIAGSVIATFVGRALGWYAAGQSAGFIGAFVGALVLLFIYHMVIKSRGTST
ncbi:GlsB/YeaQ/YmgE family stress response membrane protein [Dokdonella soli]|uniref:GlsB/YeaQ/YmgE family stress response membrane protein n=1 Tax=Dokdonella soli TaxID=529810 RepID=A0ABN1IEE9_9GAMM